MNEYELEIIDKYLTIILKVLGFFAIIKIILL